MLNFVLIFGFIVGFLGMIFFEKHDGTLIPYPTLWFYCSLVFMVGTAFFALKLNRNSQRKISKKIKKRIEEFKSSSSKLEVDLEKCEIVSNHYSEEKEIDNTWEGNTLNVFYDSSKLVENVDYSFNRLVYKTVHQGKPAVFISDLFNKDEITLKFKLVDKKSTFIYLNPESGEYYFDIEFLE